MSSIPIHERFQSTIQGEGFWSGSVADFIRLSGCPVGCPWCDTGYADGGKDAPRQVVEISELIDELRSPRVVITGGEPYIHANLPELVQAILDSGRKVSIETSGCYWLKVSHQAWITLSPKQHINDRFPVKPQMWLRANEIKLVISDGQEFDYYESRENLQRGKKSMDISTARVQRARSHYPLNIGTTQEAYRDSIKPTDSQDSQRTVVYDYIIKASFNRWHCNPPIWTDAHKHDFQVELYIQSPASPSDMYGLDMVEAESLLQQEIECIPSLINNLPDCPNGTTEQLCRYFGKIEFPDRKARLTCVSVSECPERITLLRFDHDQAIASSPKWWARFVHLLRHCSTASWR